MNKNPFLKRLMKETKGDVVHSSAYAEAQNAGGIGTTSTESFAARREIDSNRTVVKGYRDSRVVNDAFDNVGNKSQKYDAEHDASQRAAIKERFGREQNGGASSGKGGIGEQKNNSGNKTIPSGQKTTPPPMWRNPGISR